MTVKRSPSIIQKKKKSKEASFFNKFLKMNVSEKLKTANAD